MPNNPMAYGEPRSLRENEIPKGDFRNKRRPIQKILEAHGISRYEHLAQLGSGEIEDIRREIDFFRQHPEIPEAEIEQYYRDGAEVRNSIADLIGEKGRAGLEDIGKSFPEKRVN